MRPLGKSARLNNRAGMVGFLGLGASRPGAAGSRPPGPCAGGVSGIGFPETTWYVGSAGAEGANGVGPAVVSSLVENCQ